MTSPGMIGRDRELRAVEAFLRHDSWPAALVVEGAPGIGKTTLWQAALDRAAAASLTILRCRPAQAEASLAFGGLIDLLQTVGPDVLTALPVPQRVALEVALLRVPASGELPDTLAAAAGVRAAIQRLASMRPVLVAVDDAQWLDASSAGLLAYVARRLTTEPVAVMLALRPGLDGADDPMAIVAALPIERVVLAPLSLSSLHHIVGARTGHVFPRPTLHRIAEASGGNPFYAIELASAVLEADEPPAPGEPLRVPSTLADLLSMRVNRLPDDVRSVLLIIALLSLPSFDTVRRVLADDPSDALRTARAAGVLDRNENTIAFAHPLFAHYVVQIASAGEVRATHARIAAEIVDPEQRARHLALAAEPPDGEVADALESAADAARARGALRAAAELFEQASVFTPSERLDAANRRAFGAAELSVLAGDRSRAARLLHVVVETGMPSVRGRALGLLAEIAAGAGRVVEAETLLAAALVAVGDPHVAARLELDLVYTSLLRLDHDAVAEHAGRAVGHARASDDDAIRAEAHAYEALAVFLAGRGVDEARLTEAVELEDASRAPYMGLSPRGVAGLICALADRHTDARRWFAEARVGLESLGDDSDLAHVHLWSSWVEMRSGDLALAAELALGAATIAETTGSEVMRRWALAQSALIEAHRGDPGATATQLERVGAVGDGRGTLVDVWVATATGLAALSAGDRRSAWSALQKLAPADVNAELAEPATVFYLTDVVEAMIGAGLLDRAEAVLNAYDACARASGRPAPVAAGWRARGVLLATRGELGEAVRAFSEAAELTPSDMAWEIARSELERGLVQRRAGERRAAHASLDRAQELFRGVGATGWAARAALEAQRVPMRRGTGDGLTPAERRVAELSGSGRTNRDVAAALFLSPKTVEANLARIYRKLGISTRAELGSWLARIREDESVAKT